MSNPMPSPLTASSLRIEDRSQLEQFLARPESRRLIREASFEEVFFVIKHIGLADTLELLPIVTGRQVRGFIDLDCWRKDTFVRKPFMEWVAAFIQSGPEETAKALSGIDETLLALFLKDVIRVYEVERDDPPDVTQLISTPDERFAVEPIAEGQVSTIAMLILDALFKYNPPLGTQILTLIRYTSRLELEETAFENKTRRLEVHGFVDYYEALSIYAGFSAGKPSSSADREEAPEEIPGEETPGNLPAVFADSLEGGIFLLSALEGIKDSKESERLAQELTALGNRILSANLVNLGELEGVRPALEEMRDTLTIGLEYLTEGHPERATGVFQKSYMQSIFKTGFDQMAGLRQSADTLMSVPGFRLTMLDSADQEFIEGLRRFKPLMVEEGRYRNFRSIADIENSRRRLAELDRMVRTILNSPDAGAMITTTFARAFNTATIRIALYGIFDFAPLTGAEVSTFLLHGFQLPEMHVPDALQPFAARWWGMLRLEMEPLVGKRIDPRYVETVNVLL